MKRGIFILSILMILSLFLMACSEAQQSTTATTQPKTQIQTAKNPNSPATSSQNQDIIRPDSNVKTFDVIAKNWEFEPSTITVNKGDKVKITLKSIEGTHGFNLPDFNVRATLKPGNIEEIEFTADKTGTFDFYCDIPCGKGHSSMRGSLVVK